MNERVRLGPAAEIPDNDFTVYQLDAVDVVVYKIAGKYYAIGNYCPHAGQSLSRGPLDGTVITCPGHGLRFDVITGKCLDIDYLALARFDLELVDGDLYVIF
jgi:3-phenylpropionate/trans-cinnamate dioxygenase ferredoxin subunit